MASEPRLRPGFALPAVLAITGVVTLIFLVAITALASLNAEAASARARVRFIERALTVEATVAYLAATEPMDPQGFAVGGQRTFDEFAGPTVGQTSTREPAKVWMDGRAYALEVNGPVTVNLQDQAGMINLTFLDESAYRRFTALAGVAPSDARDLRARYLDYVDADDLKQLNGAEADEYGDGRGPANRPLLRPVEWLSVLGARDAVDPGQWRSLRPELASDASAFFSNVNTATSRALQVRFGISASQAGAAIRARESDPFLSLAEFGAAAGAAVAEDPETIYTFPAGRVVYVVRDGRSPWTYRGRITLTPSGVEQPLWIDQTEMLEAPGRAITEISDATPFPYAPR